ncbi:MAG: four-helix bundle copper-binding protein [Rhizobiales bacterium]|nr:four-helix bundle copper-binding protein [Hyphomicrobiales bacterium]OJY41891.1 MAG: ferredoxin [Rhizobiales bacterium 64-17]
MDHITEAMQVCIDECLRCYQACLGMAMTHCLEVGGEHTKPDHFRIMMACAEVCRTSAHVMLLQFPGHKGICRECADVCEECANDCERIGGMDGCVKTCRSCAESCREMAA